MAPSKKRRGRPPKASSATRKRRGTSEAPVETDDGFLVHLSDKETGEGEGGRPRQGSRNSKPRAKKKPARFGDMTPRESTFPRTGQVRKN
jgi:hypothetical protein